MHVQRAAVVAEWNYVEMSTFRPIIQCGLVRKKRPARRGISWLIKSNERTHAVNYTSLRSASAVRTYNLRVTYSHVGL